MSDEKPKAMENLRKEVHATLDALTPTQSNQLRARFGLDPTPADDEETLRALAQQLALRKKSKPS